jgi:hypothetical protein
MTKAGVSEADRAYFRRLGEANERLSEPDPAGTLEEVFRRIEAMERNLGSLAAPAFPLDPVAADREAASIALRFRRGRGRAT